jgi:hypothetical protein
MSSAQLLARAFRSHRSLLAALLAPCFGASAQPAEPHAPVTGTGSGGVTTHEHHEWTFADNKSFVGGTKDF